MDGPEGLRRHVAAQLELLSQIPVPGEKEKHLGVLQLLTVRHLVGQCHGPVAHTGGVRHIEGLLLRGAHDIYVNMDQVGDDLMEHKDTPAREKALQSGR